MSDEKIGFKATARERKVIAAWRWWKEMDGGSNKLDLKMISELAYAIAERHTSAKEMRLAARLILTILQEAERGERR